MAIFGNSWMRSDRTTLQARVLRLEIERIDSDERIKKLEAQQAVTNIKGHTPEMFFSDEAAPGPGDLVEVDDIKKWSESLTIDQIDDMRRENLRLQRKVGGLEQEVNALCKILSYKPVYE